MTRTIPSREAIAKKEIGHTAVSKRLGVALSVFFLVAVFSVPAGQFVYERLQGNFLSFPLQPVGGSGNSPWAAIESMNDAVLHDIDILEDTLGDQSVLRKVFLPPLQYALLRFLGHGNDKVLPGRDGWLFFAPAVDYLTGPPFLDTDRLRQRTKDRENWEKPPHADPIGAIVDFNRQLAARGITLIVMPVPVKAAIQPEKLSARLAARTERPLANRSWPDFAAALEKNGVRLFDVRSVLAKYAKEKGDAYLATDTHWLPGAMTAVAVELARAIAMDMPDLPDDTGYVTARQTVAGEGDLARMLTLPRAAASLVGQQVAIDQVTNGEAEFWQPDRNSPVLLLGDSFANIYSADGLGWGRGAGLAEQLSHALQLPLDLLARNDSGAYVTREMLAGELARGRDRLAGKRLVIWEFAERELAFGDWRIIPLHLSEPKETDFFVVPKGGKVKVTGVVEAISRSPRPGAVPYRDNILTLHLVDLRGEDGQTAAGQALVYAWGMRDNRLTNLASLRPGDTVTLTLTAWEAVEGKYGSYRRTTLDDQMVELEIPNWGVPNNEKTDF